MSVADQGKDPTESENIKDGFLIHHQNLDKRHFKKEAVVNGVKF